MNSIINRYLLSIAAFICLIPISIAQEEENEQDSRVDQLTIPFSSENERFVEAHLMHGGITVIGYEGDVVIVEAKNGRFHRDSEDESEDGLKTIRLPSSGLYAEEQDNHIKIGSNNMRGAIELTIQVPFETSLKLNCMNKGDILVENVTGEFDLENLNGKITLNNVKGAVLAHALNRDIVAIIDEVIPDKPMSFISLNGDIDVTLPSDTKASLRMETFSGTIKSDFDIDIQSKNADPKISDGREAGGRYRLEFEQAMFGNINGGGPQFVFNTHNGEIRIRQKKAE